MPTNDQPSSKGESRIKERLNLHVKKRLQESSKCSSVSSTAYDAKDNIVDTATVPSATVCPTVRRAKKSKTRNAPVPAVNVGHGAMPPVAAAITVKSSDLLLSPGAGNSNDTTNSSFNSTDQDVDFNEKDSSVDRSAGGEKSTKAGQKMDIFSLLLNQKKSSLMRDPEVISFLKSIGETKK